MKPNWIVACALASLGAGRASAVSVTFDPDPPGSNLVHQSLLPASVQFDVWLHGIPPINGAAGGLISIDLIVGSFGPLTMDDFVYNPVFVDNALLPPPTPTPVGIYWPPPASDLYFGGAQQPARRPPGPDFLLGTLTVGVPVGTPPGVHTFQIDSGYEQFSNFHGVPEPIYGLGTVVVIPEPGTIAILGMACLCLIRRAARCRSVLDRPAHEG